MEATDLTVRRRRFAGRRGAAGMEETEFAALANVLLSPRPAEPVPGSHEAEAVAAGPPAAGPPAAGPLVGRGLYLMIPAGIDPDGRREAALTAARRLAPHRGPAAVFVFENGRVDAHLLGELACGRLGPENYLGAADTDRAVGDLVGLAEQIAVIVLDPATNDLRRLEGAACRTIFLAAPNAEGIVETYRTLKAWRLSGTPSEAAVLFVDSNGDRGADDLQQRLRRAAQRFLGRDVAVQRVASVGGDGSVTELPETVRILTQTPADQVWPRLLAAAGCDVPADAVAVEGTLPPPAAAPKAAAPEAVEGPHAGPARAAAVCPAFGLWEPTDRRELLSVVREQIPSFFGDSLAFAFEVDVDEPGAPPLAAVRDDGALVAVLVAQPGEAVDTQAAERWLRVHASLLARAYPSSRVRSEAKPSAVVLAPVEATAAGDGVRRFVPVTMGGHKGVVFLP